MKTRNILLIFCFVSFTGATLFGQPVTATITQDPFSDETDVRSNVNEIIVTLTNDTLLSTVGTVDLDAKDFLAGFTGGSSAWDNIISILGAGNIILEGDGTIARITIPAQSNYYIDTDESISLTIPAGSLLSGGPAISASGSITITDEEPEISIVTETYLETDIRAGAIQFDITLSGDEWENTLTTTFGDSIDSDGSGWDTQIKPSLIVNRISNTIVRVTIPQTPSFDILSNENVTIEVSAANLQHTSGSLVFAVSGRKDIDRLPPYMVLTSVPSPLTEQNLALDNAVLRVELFEAEVVGSSFDRFNFVLATSPTDMTSGGNGNLRIDADADITSPSSNVFEIVLSWNYFSGGIDEDHLLGLTIDADEVTGNDDISIAPTLDILSTIVPNITSVTIPDTRYGIGSDIIATVRVTNDRGSSFDYESGTIAGRTPASIDKINNTTYELTIPVTEGSNPQYTAGDPIPVTDLQFSNNGENGNQYTTSIVQGNDPIDTERPEVTLISIDNGTYRVGDDITVIVDAGEPGIGFDGFSTRINGERLNQSNVSFSEVGSGFYQFTYTVKEGDDDISGTIPVTMVAEDLVGNDSDPYSTVSGLPSVIDANSPEILSVDEPTEGVTAIPGDLVELVVTTSESGLTLGSGTEINGVVPSGFSPAGDVYTITYTVGADDPEVISGNLTATIILEDAAGNSTTQVNGIDNNDIAIVTTEPFATISGGGEMCAGETSTIYINPSGRSPFNINITVFENGGLYDVDTMVTGPFSIDVSPAADADYTINQITDGLGIAGSAEGTASVTVNDLPIVSIKSPSDDETEIPLGSSQNLVGDPMGGIFSGPGVESPANIFHPDLVGEGNVKIIYTFTESNTGCLNTDSVELEVVANRLEIDSLPEIICFNTGVINIEGRHLTEDNGRGIFTLYSTKDIKRTDTLSYIDDNEDGTAQLNPSEIPGGSYVVRFSYTYPVNDTTNRTEKIEETFTLDRFVPARITKDPGASVCRNDDPSLLEGNLDRPGANYTFSGPGVSMDIPYEFDPSAVEPGQKTIKYEFESDLGCSDTYSHTLTVFDIPELSFTKNDSCIPFEGGIVSFNHASSETGLVEKWSWDFGDVESGSENFRTTGEFESLVSHKYTKSGDFDVLLETVTFNGCEVSLEQEITLGDEPVADFRWNSDCYIAGDSVRFFNESLSKSGANYDRFTWNIYKEDESLLATFDTLTPFKVDTFYYFDDFGTYYIELITENVLGCVDTKYDTLKFKETFDFTEANGRFMDFNLDEVWSSVSRFNDSSSAWTYGVPDFNGYEPEPEDNLSWYTSLEDGIIENSWIQSQCFNFRELERPMIRMDVMRSFDNNRDGAVIQYTRDNGFTWTTIGDVGEGIGWYNAYNTKEKPGGGKDGEGSSVAWSGEEVFNPDSTWVTVAHDLDDIAGAGEVIFGVFYATDGASVVGNQGFAVDNVYVGERTKMSLLEHFTNAGDSDATAADGEINDFVDDNSLDVTSLQYHMHYPEDDPMNAFNPAPPASRSFYYGVTEIPFAFLDGGLSEDFAYNFDPSTPTANQLKTLTLESPLFDLEVSYQVKIDNNRISPKIEFAALEDLDSMELVLNVAVIEKTVEYTGGQGANEFRNVVRNMLPSAAGTIYTGSWEMDEIKKEVFHWYYDDAVDPAELAVIAFLQDRETGKVLQVAKADSAEFPLPAIEKEVHRLKIYPNPAGEYLFVEDERFNQPDITIEVLDMTGRVLLNEDCSTASFRVKVDIGSLSEGTYILQLKTDGTVSGRETFVKIWY